MRVHQSILLTGILVLSVANANAADLAASLCQDEFTVSDEKLCQGLLIGAIDALAAQGQYCPDGATSYGHIISAWRRLLKREPTLKTQPTVVSMRRVLSDLSLECSK